MPVVAFVFLAVDVGFVALSAQTAPPMAENVFKNIQVLKGIPVDQFMGTMSVFSSATGLNCTDCHIEDSGGDWGKYADDNALKQRARTMVVMMATINRTNFGGRQVVTCFTCHRGSSRPTVMPSIDLLYSSPPPDEPGDLIAQAPRQPAADQILDRYLQALGGPQRLAALRSYTAKGTYIGFDDAEKSPMEVYVKAPAQRTMIVRGRSGNTTTTFDGSAGWLAAPLTDRPVALIETTGQELEGLKAEMQLLFPAQIRQALTNWRVGFPTAIGDRDVQLVQGTTAGGAVVTLCFDAETGLLTRLVRFSVTPVGRVATRVDYSDYREVAGVKIPFKWTTTWLGGRSNYELTAVEPNTAIDAARFARPR
ncbi:MAG: photosynthetic reaction center cytochrome c subunit [Acidobacteria bacterium]|nr:photosynthetic reaction center cytochrome c subunit [Acidobacteriota bacterium]